MQDDRGPADLSFIHASTAAGIVVFRRTSTEQLEFLLVISERHLKKDSKGWTPFSLSLHPQWYGSKHRGLDIVQPAGTICISTNFRAQASVS